MTKILHPATQRDEEDVEMGEQQMTHSTDKPFTIQDIESLALGLDGVTSVRVEKDSWSVCDVASPWTRIRRWFVRSLLFRERQPKCHQIAIYVNPWRNKDDLCDLHDLRMTVGDYLMDGSVCKIYAHRKLKTFVEN